MSKKFLVPIDMSGLEIQNFLAHNLASAPTGVAGKVYFNTVDHKLYYHNGTVWVDLTANVDPNEFGKIKVGSTLIEADAVQDTLEFVAGSNVTITPDATNDKVTISATDTTYTPASATPLMDGTGAVGTSVKYAREDHRHPSDTNKVDKVSGKGLSTNDYTNEDKAKVDAITYDGILSFYKKMESTYTTESATAISTIPIGISGFGTHDMLFVDINGLDLIQGTDYTVSGTNIILTTPITASGTKVHFVALRALAATSEEIEELLAGGKVHYGECSTAAATTAKTVTTTDGSYELKTGSAIFVKFTVTNTGAVGSLTLDVDSTGAKPIKYRGSNLPSAGTLSANRLYSFIYDGTNYNLLGDLDTNTTYTNASLGQGYGTCSTAESTTAKVVTLSSYALTTGGVVVVKFTNAVPANATMNINSKGAKNIYYQGGAITAGVISAGDIATFIYDGTQYHLLTVDTVFTPLEKTKLAGIATGAEVNQNAFSKVAVNGQTTVEADAKTDTLTLVAGSNVAITTDNTNDKVTITATDTTYSDATTSASGLMSASDKTKLNGIASGAEVNVQSDWNQTTTTADDYIKNKPTLGTAAAKNSTTSVTSGGTDLPTSGAVYTAIGDAISASDAMIFKGTIGASADSPTVTALPTTYKTGWTYRVVTAGEYGYGSSGKHKCEVGDLIIALVDRSGSGNTNADWTVAQTNIDGAITSISGTSPISVTGSGSSRTVSINASSDSSAGSMSSAHYTKLEGIEAGAQVNRTYSSFTGKPTGNQTPSFGSTFTISQISQSTAGQVSGTDRTVKIPDTLASASVNGLMSSTMFSKLNGLTATKTGTVTIASGSTSVDASVADIIAYTAKDASTGEEVVIDVTKASNKVTFSIAASYTNAINITYLTIA